jgi:hypothetical protein
MFDKLALDNIFRVKYFRRIFIRLQIWLITCFDPIKKVMHVILVPTVFYSNYIIFFNLVSMKL